MPRVVSKEEWLAARTTLLELEKEAIALRDRINAERLALPWVKVDRAYSFDSPRGKQTLAELFGGRSQLIVYHFMFAPGWGAGCVGCSFLADHLEAARPHLESHDVTIAAVSRAPLAEIEAYKARMGWRFPWVSSYDCAFNYDFGVSFTPQDLQRGSVRYNFADLDAKEAHEELPGLSAFALGETGEVFHTYSTYARGLEDLLSAYMILDRAPKGRNESGPLSWVRRHDEYQVAPRAAAWHQH